MNRTFEALQAAAGPVSRETFEALQLYESHFRKWNAHINLASASTLDAFWDRHVIDSAQLFTLRKNSLYWVDLGSGGGLPGVVLSILCRDVLGASVDLVESNRKKAGFLLNAVSLCKGKGTIHAKRIEDAVIHVKHPDIVTARALAPLPALLALVKPYLDLKAGSRALLHKGRGYREEIAESRRNWTFDLVEHPSIVDPHSVVLEISNLVGRS
jgi:16S rRNA (guanine527-N7)-methyltransferase